MKYKITVVGSGYVGMSLAALLSAKHDILVYDIDNKRVDKINNKISTVSDEDIDNFLRNQKLSLEATTDINIAFKNSKFIIVATPTDYDVDSNKFNTSSVESVIENARSLNPDALIIIKSTIPVGFTKEQNAKHNTDKIIFSPEFLREGKALADNLYPSRIVVGSNSNDAIIFGNILKDCSNKKNAKVLHTKSNEAEAINLCANTYLAMRVAFFNELDTYAIASDLDSESIINGISLDSRIGEGYNNPSFGYGGYCLPKDTKQLLANYSNIPQDLINAIVQSNETRKDFITNEILKRKPKIVGLYRLIMKEGSDNFRSSAVLGIIDRLQQKNIKIIIFEPLINSNEFNGLDVTDDLSYFKDFSQIILTNRISDNLLDVSHKVFTRDIYKEN